MYATAQDMIDRFGLTEMLRLSKPEDRDATEIDQAIIDKTIDDACAMADGYLRGYYQLPVENPPKDLVRAVCVLARYDLADGGRSEPSDHMTKARNDVIAWLEKIATGKVRIDAAVATSSNSDTPAGGAKFSDRDGPFTNQSLKDW